MLINSLRGTNLKREIFCDFHNILLRISEI